VGESNDHGGNDDLASVDAIITRVKRQLERKDLDATTREGLERELKVFSGMRMEILKSDMLDRRDDGSD
jgi:hypothetical protein